jgi:cell shape-determining protein MreC
MEPNRYVCTVLQEARAALERMNHMSMFMARRHLATLLEEIQTCVNRMESSLQDASDYEYTRELLKNENVMLKELTKERKQLEFEIEQLRMEMQEIEEALRISSSDDDTPLVRFNMDDYF